MLLLIRWTVWPYKANCGHELRPWQNVCGPIRTAVGGRRKFECTITVSEWCAGASWPMLCSPNGVIKTKATASCKCPDVHFSSVRGRAESTAERHLLALEETAWNLAAPELDFLLIPNDGDYTKICKRVQLIRLTLSIHCWDLLWVRQRHLAGLGSTTETYALPGQQQSNRSQTNFTRATNRFEPRKKNVFDCWSDVLLFTDAPF